jgi:hypothetical protein
MSMAMKVSATAAGPNNQNITVDLTVTVKVDETFSELKKQRRHSGTRALSGGA